LKDLLERSKVKVSFVHGTTEGKTRQQVKEALIKKKTKVVISTAVWREGIDIPSLDCVVNACGGKSEIMTIQAIGRGLRKTDEKGEVEIIDFLDPYRYLAEHAIQRMNVYYREQWI
jgi:superfamily II DNA or RNA helicase